MAHIRFNRCSEMQFRTNVPVSVSSFTVLEVVGYRAGGSGMYACAFTLSQDGDKFATHRIVCMDDNPVGTLRWNLMHGHYDFNNREEAFADLVSRATNGRLPVSVV
jgi:hypothetical protein